MLNDFNKGSIKYYNPNENTKVHFENLHIMQWNSEVMWAPKFLKLFIFIRSFFYLHLNHLKIFSICTVTNGFSIMRTMFSISETSLVKNSKYNYFRYQSIAYSKLRSYVLNLDRYLKKNWAYPHPSFELTSLGSTLNLVRVCGIQLCWK